MHHIVDADMAATITSDPIDMRDHRALSLILAETRVASVGVWSCEVSNKFSKPAADDDEWFPYTLPDPLTDPAGETGDYHQFVELAPFDFNWARFIYTRTSGSGTLQGHVEKKDAKP